MDFITQNWFWIVLIGLMVGMHLSGHGGCGAHGAHGGEHGHTKTSDTNGESQPAHQGCH
jgi:hypothetical protein